MKNKRLSGFLNQNLSAIQSQMSSFEPQIKLKKLKQSNDKLFQNIKSKSRKNSHSVQSYSVLVTSKQQQELMSFIHSRKLPKLAPQIQNKRSSLDKILKRKQKFKKDYFAEIHHFHKYGEKTEISFEFPKVKIGEWTVSGYIMGDYILLKGVAKKNREKFKKFRYDKVYGQVRRNYEMWVEEQFMLDEDQ